MAEAAGAPERKVYEAGTGRKTILSLAFPQHRRKNPLLQNRNR